MKTDHKEIYRLLKNNASPYLKGLQEADEVACGLVMQKILSTDGFKNKDDLIEELNKLRKQKIRYRSLTMKEVEGLMSIDCEIVIMKRPIERHRNDNIVTGMIKVKMLDEIKDSVDYCNGKVFYLFMAVAELVNGKIDKYIVRSAIRRRNDGS